MQATLDPAQVFHNRELSCYFDDDGMLVIRGRLTADQGAAFMQAIDSLREPPDNEEIDDTFRTTAADALAKMAELSLNTHAGDARTADRFQVRVSVPAETLLRQGLTELDAEQTPALDNGPAISLQTAHRLTCDCATINVVEDQDGNPLDVGRKTRTVPLAIRRALERRDGGCRFPGCTQTRHVDAHHVQHWAHGGKTKLSNLVLLCRRHHTWLHEGGYGLDVTPNGFQFTTPRGYAIEQTGDKRFRGNVSTLIEENEASQISISPTTADCNWDGKPANWDHIMFVLCQKMKQPTGNHSDSGESD